MEELINYIGRPVWDGKNEEWFVISEIAFSHSAVYVYGTDGKVREFSRGLDVTWLHMSDT